MLAAVGVVGVCDVRSECVCADITKNRSSLMKLYRFAAAISSSSLSI